MLSVKQKEGTVKGQSEGPTQNGDFFTTEIPSKTRRGEENTEKHQDYLSAEKRKETEHGSTENVQSPKFKVEFATANRRRKSDPAIAGLMPGRMKSLC